MSSLRRYAVVLATCCLLSEAGAFYEPGTHPRPFQEGDSIDLKVNKMTSIKTLMPMDYYKLPFCAPEGGGPKRDYQNLGQFLAGDSIQSSPYRLKMKTEMYCEQLCIANVGDGAQQGVGANKFVRAIQQNYHNNWIVDNLPAASKVEDEKTIKTRYWRGFPIGYVDEKGRAFINNHVNIEIMYHQVETETDKYRVVRFTVQPFSIKHEYELEGRNSINITNPIESCSGKSRHTDYNMVKAKGREPQPASGKVLFTYDVQWKENSDLHWGSRWDIYLSMNNLIPANIHWFSITNSLVIAIFLSAAINAISARKLRRAYARHRSLATDEETVEDTQLFRWRLVRADVFRPPTFSPLLLSVACGTGAQILLMSFLTIVFAMTGFLNPANRGALLMAELLLYVTMGGFAGYVTARLYRTFKGKSWQAAAALTALGFPGIVFGFFLMMHVVAVNQESTLAVPSSIMIMVLFLWLGISTPLVFFGAYFGYKRDAIEFPVETSSIPRQIPNQPWFMSIVFPVAIGGILLFSSCNVELYLILASLWMDQYYYTFGFLLLVFVILMVTCAEIAVLCSYLQLCRENYRWWWRSFWTGGSMALYVLLDSIHSFLKLETDGVAVTSLLYFGTMGLISLGLFLMTGFIGVASSLTFHKSIFAIEFH